MDRVICSFCGKEFKKKKSQIERFPKNYCSKKCFQQSKRKGKYVSCFVCGKSVYKSEKDLKRSISKKYFCSRQCGNKYIGLEHRGIKSPNWNGGTSSYKDIIKRTNIEQICVFCERNDRRILVVHHIDKNRKNNNESNLMWLCRNCHFLVHNYKDELKKLDILIKK